MIRYILKHIIIASTIMALAADSGETYEDENNSSDESSCSDDSCYDISSGEPVVCDPPCSGGPFDICQVCTTHCPATCEHKSVPCLESCGPKGCQCKLGYVRGPGDICILPQDCPNTRRDKATAK